MNKPLIVITLGEPGGIGADICLDLPVLDSHNLLLIGDLQLLDNRAQMLHKTVKLRQVNLAMVLAGNLENQPDEIPVLHVECQLLDTVGKLRSENSAYVLKLIDVAADLCKTGVAAAMVTAPVSKEVINAAGYKFFGHTEYLADKFAVNKVVMMLANVHMKVALLTTHLPLKDVASHITQADMGQTIQIIINAFKDYYKISNPRIGVCGLNPHAGEGGYMGREEIDIINPEIKRWQDLGYHVSGAYPADTIFNHLANFDVILAMYHDQGLPVLKYADFENGINVTLGLPILRVSVDHGTALKLAGTGMASSKSLIYAINQAVLLTNRKG